MVHDKSIKEPTLVLVHKLTWFDCIIKRKLCIEYYDKAKAEHQKRMFGGSAKIESEWRQELDQ